MWCKKQTWDKMTTQTWNVTSKRYKTTTKRRKSTARWWNSDHKWSKTSNEWWSWIVCGCLRLVTVSRSLPVPGCLELQISAVVSYQNCLVRIHSLQWINNVTTDDLQFIFCQEPGLYIWTHFFLLILQTCPPPFFKTVQQTHIYCWLILDFHQ